MQTEYKLVKASIYVPQYQCPGCGALEPASVYGDVKRAGDTYLRHVTEFTGMPGATQDSLVATSYAAPAGWREIEMGVRSAYIFEGWYCPACSEIIFAFLLDSRLPFALALVRRLRLDSFDAESVQANPSAHTWAEIATARLYVLTNPQSHIDRESGGVLCGSLGVIHAGPAVSTCFKCLTLCAEGEK